MKLSRKKILSLQQNLLSYCFVFYGCLSEKRRASQIIKGQ